MISLKEKVIFGLCCALVIFGITCYVFNKAEPIDLNKPIDAILKLNEKEKQDVIRQANLAYQEAEKIKLSSEADKAALKAQIAALRARLPKTEPLPVAPSDLGPTPSADPAPNEALSISLEVIKKQDYLISTLESDLKKALEQVQLYKRSSEQFKIALEVSQRNEAVLRIAKDAQIEAIKSAKMRGRLEGFTFAALADIGVRIATR